ncbi:MAG: M48 family metallopeptidase [Muribaculaceae bacterium]|nr:M48 family metallopeptidase [Muribaculaceae bacterium]
MFAAFIACAGNVSAQFNAMKALGSAAKAAKAFTLSDEQMAAYVKESVDQMDKLNPVLPEDDPYTVRLRNLTNGITEADGIPLNFKVYNVVDVNAFACPDGSVRVFAALMDIMNDDELMGIIGHEIGHVLKRHSKNAFKNQLLTGALKDAIASTGGKAAALTESQLSTLGESLMSAQYSQKQQKEADDCGYDFLVANGRNPWGMVMSFEKLLSLEGNSGKKVGNFANMFSSHPDTKARIERMTKRCNADGYTRPETK